MISSVCAIIPAVTADELAKAAELLRAILAAVERGELTGPPGLIARLEGALAAAEEIARTSL